MKLYIKHTNHHRHRRRQCRRCCFCSLPEIFGVHCCQHRLALPYRVCFRCRRRLAGVLLFQLLLRGWLKVLPTPPPPLAAYFCLLVRCGSNGAMRCGAVLCLQTMSSLLNLIANIWESILPALGKPVNQPSLQLVQQTVTGELDPLSPT